MSPNEMEIKEMKTSLIEICDEIFQSQKLPIHSRVRISKRLFFFDFPRYGLMTVIEDRPEQGCISVQSEGGEMITQMNVDYLLTTAGVEGILRRLHEELSECPKQPTHEETKAHHKPETVLKIDEYTPTDVLETLAALALGWDDIKEELYKEDGEVCLTYEWKPTKHSIQALHLASKLGLQVSGNSPAEIRFNITLAAAQKYVQGA